jgi:hypothetical protein
VLREPRPGTPSTKRCHDPRPAVPPSPPNQTEPDSATPSVSEEAWREIEATLGLTAPDPDLRRKLTHRIIDFLEHPPLEDPRPAEVRRWLMRVQKNAERLLSDFEFPDKLDEESWQRFLVANSELRWDVLERLVSTLNSLIKLTQERLENTPPDKGGKPSDEFSWGAIYDLATIFHSATGKKPTVAFDPYAASAPYKGAFFNFAEKTYRHLAPRYVRTNQAFGKLAQRALWVWRKKHLPSKDKTHA